MGHRDKVIQPRATRFWHEALPPLLLVCFVLLVWQTVAVRSGLSAFILPSPIQVAQATYETWDILLPAIGTTMVETGIGLGIAIVFGVVIAGVRYCVRRGNRRRDGHLKLAAQIALSNPCRFTDRADSGDRTTAHNLVRFWASAEGSRRDPDLLLSVGSQYG